MAKSHIRYKGLTLIELIIVITVVLILIGITLPNYNKAKESALNKEVIAGLKLIRAAEKIYHMENSLYYPMSDTESVIATINDDLKLGLTEANWDYLLDSDGKAEAQRSGSGRTWSISFTDDNEPTCTGGTPCN